VKAIEDDESTARRRLRQLHDVAICMVRAASVGVGFVRF
jgi:hypothetical protein